MHLCLPAMLLIMVLVLKETACYSLRQLKLYEFQEKLQERRFSGIAASESPLPFQLFSVSRKSDGRVFYPIGYGADPTGTEDSTGAIMAALDAAFKVRNMSEMLPGINDLGGVIVDLQGGSFRISSPLRFPPGIGNILVQRGSLRASITFPRDRHLIELWSPNSGKLERQQESLKHVNNNNVADFEDQIHSNTTTGIYYEDITFRDILFDSSFQGGGLFIVDSARIRINNCFFLHFTTEGMLVERGHETFISGCFLGQHSTTGGDRGERNFTGTGIDLASTDNAVTDVAIFSAATGIILRGQANIVRGVHCYNKASNLGGIGILVKSSQTRIEGCYMDYNTIVLEDPKQILVSNCYFLGDGNIVLRSLQGQISGLNIVNNIFCGDANKMYPTVILEGQFLGIDQVVIDNNIVNGMSLRSTVGKMAVAGNGTQWVADFSSLLVFPNKINHVYYSFYSRGENFHGFPAHFVLNVSNNVVIVESENVSDGVVSVLVDQHNMQGEGENLYM